MSTRPFSRNREEAEKDPEASSEEATADSADETVMAPAEEAETTTAMGDCAICHQPVTSDQDYHVAAYGVVHSDPCSHQTHRT